MNKLLTHQEREKAIRKIVEKVKREVYGKAKRSSTQ